MFREVLVFNGMRFDISVASLTDSLNSICNINIQNRIYIILSNHRTQQSDAFSGIKMLSYAT